MIKTCDTLTTRKELVDAFTDAQVLSVTKHDSPQLLETNIGSAPPDQFSRHMAPKTSYRSEAKSVNAVAARTITHKRFTDKAVTFNSTLFCHFLESMHANDVDLRPVFFRKPRIRRSFILPTLVPKYGDPSTTGHEYTPRSEDSLVMTYPSKTTNVRVNAGHVIANKHVFDERVLAPNLCFFSLELPHANPVVLQAIFHNAPATQHPQDFWSLTHRVTAIDICKWRIHFAQPHVRILGTINVTTCTVLDSHPAAIIRSTTSFLSKLATVGIGTDRVRHFSSLSRPPAAGSTAVRYKRDKVSHQRFTVLTQQRWTDWDSRVCRYVQIMILMSRLQCNHVVNLDRAFMNSLHRSKTITRKNFLALSVADRAQVPVNDSLHVALRSSSANPAPLSSGHPDAVSGAEYSVTSFCLSLSFFVIWLMWCEHEINHRRIAGFIPRRNTDWTSQVRCYVEVIVLMSCLQSDCFVHVIRDFKDSRHHTITIICDIYFSSNCSNCILSAEYFLCLLRITFFCFVIRFPCYDEGIIRIIREVAVRFLALFFVKIFDFSIALTWVSYEGSFILIIRERAMFIWFYVVFVFVFFFRVRLSCTLVVVLNFVSREAAARLNASCSHFSISSWMTLPGYNPIQEIHEGFLHFFLLIYQFNDPISSMYFQFHLCWFSFEAEHIGQAVCDTLSFSLSFSFSRFSYSIILTTLIKLLSVFIFTCVLSEGFLSPSPRNDGGIILIIREMLQGYELCSLALQFRPFFH
jgi:hypothetical protein